MQLSLFPELCLGGVDLAQLREAADQLRRRSLRSAATIRGYGRDWSHFVDWCRAAGRDDLPAEHETVCLYAVWMMEERGLHSSTAGRHLAAIGARHRDGGYPVPVDARTRELVTAVRRKRRDRAHGKAALSVEDLCRACLACDIGHPSGLRDRAILTLGFGSGCRRSELARLDVGDVTFRPEGLVVRVLRSKRDQEGRGRLVGVFAGQRPQTDPVRTLQAWLTMRGPGAGPLFTRIRRGDVLTLDRLHDDAYNRIVKASVESIGLAAACYGAHSLRAGLVTAAAEHGATDAEIMMASGHESAEVMRGYIRSARLFTRRNPLAGAL